jgi:predicted DNA-binding transcriptional regulator YafY
MDRTERLYKIDQLLNERRAVAMDILEEELGISKSTVTRDLEYMRDRLNAPIIWDRALRGYVFDHSQPGAQRYALPGLWFNDQEIFALLTMYQLLSNLGNGLLTPHINPLLARLTMLLGSQEDSADEIRNRIRILHMASRTERPESFEIVASGTIKRKRLQFVYRARYNDRGKERRVSPQRLVHYRDNWYLDGWCHLSKGLRTFSIDRISEAKILEQKSRDVSEKTLHRELAGGYGIFSGKADKRAKLRFSPRQARWVASENWHPKQSGQFEKGGYYLLEFPYSNDTELVMDILKYGSGVEVISPSTLRNAVKRQLKAAVSQYS